MRNVAISMILGAILFTAGLEAANDKKKDVPVAPLPAVIVNRTGSTLKLPSICSLSGSCVPYVEATLIRGRNRVLV
jgi:hypothetical protein